MTAAALSLALFLLEGTEPAAIAALERHCAEPGQPSQVELAQGWLAEDAYTGFDPERGFFTTHKAE